MEQDRTEQGPGNENKRDQSDEGQDKGKYLHRRPASLRGRQREAIIGDIRTIGHTFPPLQVTMKIRADKRMDYSLVSTRQTSIICRIV